MYGACENNPTICQKKIVPYATKERKSLYISSAALAEARHLNCLCLVSDLSLMLFKFYQKKKNTSRQNSPVDLVKKYLQR